MADKEAFVKSYQAFFCSHTHWDREWYGTLQQFRLRLVQLVDNLLDLLERDPEYHCFNLDGQTIVLEDYLEIRPEREPLLRRFIEQGRIVVGPWYILPDEFIVGGEATIRNLAKGMRLAESYGACSRVGYLPDMFGHISQMPQIFRGLGIDNALVWRGLTGPDLKSEFRWRSPDGSEVLALRIPEYSGYCNAAFFWASLPEKTRERLGLDLEPFEVIADDVELVLDALTDILALSKEHTQAGQLLMLNGVDHMFPQPTIPEILRRAAERFPDTEFFHASLDEYVEAVRVATEGQELQTRVGELKDTGWHRGGNIVLPNILSSRVYQKLENATCQNLLAHWAEPTGLMSDLMGGRSFHAFIEKGWEWLIQNHPHDSIGGCSADPVHDQMDARFEWAHELAAESTANHMWDIAQSITPDAVGAEEQMAVLFNPLPWARAGHATVCLKLPDGYLRKLKLAGFEFTPQNLPYALRQLRLTDASGRAVPHQVERVEYDTECHSFLPRFVATETVARVWVNLPLDLVPPLGYKALRVAPDPVKKLEFGSLVTGHQTLENEYLRVSVRDNGALDILDKRTGKEWCNQLLYEDGGDNGDGYNYSPPRFNQVYGSGAAECTVALVSDGPVSGAYEITHSWDLPIGLDESRQCRSSARAPLRITTRVELGQHDEVIRCSVRLRNTHRNHRLRLLFPTALQTNDCFADGQFDLIRRPIRIPQPPREVWIEDQPRQYPVQTFCGLSDGKEGLAVFLHGLHEFEVIDRPDRSLAVTLLRAVEFLGAGGDLNTIRGGAGPMIRTPGGQCLRELEYRFAICPFQGTPEAARVPRKAMDWQVGAQAFVSCPGRGAAPAERSFFELTGDPSILVSAVKRSAVREDQWVIRLWNCSDRPVAGNLELRVGCAGGWWVDLLDQPQSEARCDGNRITLELGAKAIRSLALQLKPDVVDSD